MILLLLLSFILSIVNGSAPLLRKHHYQIQSPIDETDLLIQQQGTAPRLLYSANTESVCGEASLSCMTFGSTTSSFAIRCGVLDIVPVCSRLDSVTNQLKCDSFCDTDGSGRLCEKAFEECCRESINGCISSQPRNVKLYNKD